MLLREIFIGGARAPPAPPHATALPKMRQLKHKVRAHAMTGMFTAIFSLSSTILSNM